MISSLGTFGQQFYPTPEKVVRKMLRLITLEDGMAILEPSAGKGDIVDVIRDIMEKACCHRWNRTSGRSANIDTIEVDPDLQRILRGKNYRVVHDDFLTFDTFKRYDLIVMNPPFANGDQHLAKAMTLLKPGGTCVCLLHWETVANPFSNQRKALLHKLESWNADIVNIGDAFKDAERKTGVQVARIIVARPEEEQGASILLDGLKKEIAEERELNPERFALVDADPLRAEVARFNLVIRAGLRLIEEYRAYEKHLPVAIPDDSGRSRREDPMFSITVKPNEYVAEIRMTFWRALFENPVFVDQLTSNLREELINRVESLRHYDFSEFNINALRVEIFGKIVEGVEQTIINLFDKLSYQHHYREGANRNIHYFDGWKTNQSWFINKKVILPHMKGLFSQHYYDWSTKATLIDIEKCLDYLDDNKIIEKTTEELLEESKKDPSDKVRLRHIEVTFYKKGSAHIVFLKQDLLDKLNIFGCRKKGWLPPGYGKTKYEDLTPEEKKTVDSFHGEQKYREVCNRSELLAGCGQTMQLLGFTG